MLHGTQQHAESITLYKSHEGRTQRPAVSITVHNVDVADRTACICNPHDASVLSRLLMRPTASSALAVVG